jgi:hypothetical protein
MTEKEKNNLMRGDYVMFFRRKIGKIAKVDQVLRHSCLLLYNEGPDDKGYESEIIVNDEDIKPIIVNDAFLSAHGFVVDFKGATLEYEHNGLRRYFYLSKKYDSNTKKEIEEYYVGKDNYTNQLHIIQNAMRLDLMDEFEY